MRLETKEETIFLMSISTSGTFDEERHCLNVTKQQRGKTNGTLFSHFL